MPYVLALEDVNKGTKNVGNKAANLGEMLKSGLPVPTGFVITSEAFDFFLKVNRLEERIQLAVKEIDADNTDQLHQKSRQIEDLIISGEIPDSIRREAREFYENIGVGREARMLGGAALDIIRAGRERVFVAVRSSATTEDSNSSSFAGQMRTYLNINGADKILEAVKRCWASLFTARAIFYRKKRSIQGPLATAIVVQKMLEPEKSGIIFTADPVDGNKNKIIIEASYGLGQSVASGFVIPDRYCLDKNTSQLLEKTIGKKSILFKKDQIGKTIIESLNPEKASSQVLLDPEITKLFEITRRIENLYAGQPQDIEWCIERGRVFVLQARPITTLNAKPDYNQLNQQTQPLLKGSMASAGKFHGKAKVITSPDDMPKIFNGGILIAKTTNPEFVPYLGKISAIITDESGITSHFATVCREFGMPFISGTVNATQLISDEHEISGDGNSGNIYLAGPTPQNPPEVLQEKIYQPAEDQSNLNPEDLTATEIKINLTLLPGEQKLPALADGINPLNIEHAIISSGKNPFFLSRANPSELVSLLIEKIGPVAVSAKTKPVWYKSIDIRADQFSDLIEEEPKETNPLLGRRGIRASVANEEILRCELKALKTLKENGLSNVNILLPFVTTPDEITFAKKLVDFPLSIGIIAETPAALMDIERICRAGADFVAIDMNNLAQMTLAVDRSNPNVSSLYSENHPAVLNLIRQAAKICKNLGIKCSIFGDGAITTAEMVEKFVEFGIDSISVDPDSFDSVKTAVIRAEKRLLLDKARKEKGL